MKAIFISRASAGAAILLASMSLLAAESDGSLKVAQQGAISYVSGGIGQEEVAAMRAEANSFNLRMAFSSLAGEFLADVKVTLADKKGNVVLNTLSDGPCLYAKVPPGIYKLTAETMNKAITKPVELAGKRSANVQFAWATPSPNEQESIAERDEQNKTRAKRGCF